MTSPLTNRDKQELFRIYKTNQNGTFISKKVGICLATVLKVIKQERFKERLAMIQTAALEIVDTNQAQMLAEDLMELTNIQSMITDHIQNNPEMGFTVADLERVMKLRYHLMGMPDTTVAIHDASIEVQEVVRADVIDADYEEVDKNKTEDGKKPFENIGQI